MIQANEGLLKNQVKKHNMVMFSIFFKIEVCSVYSLESPQFGDSYEYT